MAENIYNWQYNTIPGNANQGAILMTRNDITQPPFNQTDFIWKAMEDIIGVANVKFEYDEINNKYHIFKATGHRDNNGNWTYNWEEFGSWDALSEEVVETLRMLKYVEYIFDTSIPNTLKVSGKKKDGTIELLTNISFASTQYVDQKVLDLIQDNLTTALNKTWSIDKIKSYIDTIGHFNYKGAINKNTLPTVAAKGDVYKVNEENDLYVNISSTNVSNFVPFTDIADAFTTYAIELHKSNNGLYAKLRYDTIDFMIDNAYNLKSILIDDTLDAGDTYANRKTYSIDKILSLLSSSMRYKGQVNYYDLLPTTGNVTGDTWNVKYEGPSSGGSTELDGDNYCWNGTSWDDLSGEYRAGVGIVIQGKTISSTGINFRVGKGLQIIGSGNNATLETRNGYGLEYQNVGTTADPVYANKVKPKTNGGIQVDTNGVSVIPYNGILVDSNGISAIPYNGIQVDTNGISVNPNTNKGIDVTSNGVEAKVGTGLRFNASGNIESNGNYAYRPWLIVPASDMNTFTNQLLGQRITENSPLSIELDLTSVATPLFTLESGANYFFLLDGWFGMTFVSDAITTTFENIYVKSVLRLGNQDISEQRAYNQGSNGQTPYIGYALPYAMRASYRQPSSTNKFSINISVGVNDSVTVNAVSAYELKVFAIKR